MKYRIAGWAVAGFLVATFWGVYFAMANKQRPIDPIVSFTSRLTCPIGILGSHSAISLWWAVLANLATYALIGVLLELLRKQLTHSR